MVATTADGRATRAPEGLRLAGWGVAALVVAVVRNGVWATPNLPFFTAIARNLGRNPFPRGLDGDYLLTNLLGPSVAAALGQTSDHAYARLHLVLLVGGLALVVAATMRRFGYRTARTLVWVLAASPAVTVCLEWLGQPDALTLPLALGLGVARRRVALLGLAVLLGLNHPEQGLVAAGVAAAIRPFCGGSATTDGADLPENGARWRVAAFDALALVGGVAIGRGITQLYLSVNDIVVSRPRTAYLCLGVRGFADFHLTSPVALVVNFWGPLWLALCWLTWRWWTDRTVVPWWPVLMGVAAAALIPVAVTLDETRVYALTTAPLLIGLAMALTRTAAPAVAVAAPGRPRAALAVAGIVALAAVPGGFSAGAAYWAPALRPTEFARFLVDGHTPDDQPVAEWLLSPFGFRVPPSC